MQDPKGMPEVAEVAQHEDHIHTEVTEWVSAINALEWSAIGLICVVLGLGAYLVSTGKAGVRKHFPFVWMGKRNSDESTESHE